MTRRFIFFGRHGEALFTPPNSAEDWQAGDVAECLYSGGWIGMSGHVPKDVPVQGERYRVVHVLRDPQQYLCFSLFGPQGWNAAFFRKVRPQPDEAIAADPAFLGECLRPRELVQ
jgi:hypothetical protein